MAIPQTSVKSALSFAQEGQHFPQEGEAIDSYTAVASATIAPGVFVIRGTAPAEEVDVLAGTETTWEDLLGVSLLDSLRSSVNYSENEVVPVLTRGRVAVATLATATVADVVHVYKSGANKGKVDVASQGVAQVTTVTPTAVNDAFYALLISFTAGPAKGQSYTLTFVGDGSATATEICDGLRVQLNADANLSALITDSGTATLILTATDKESIFDVSDGSPTGTGGPALAIAATTAGAPTTLALPKERARFVVGGSTSSVPLLEISL